MAEPPSPARSANPEASGHRAGFSSLPAPRVHLLLMRAPAHDHHLDDGLLDRAKGLSTGLSSRRLVSPSHNEAVHVPAATQGSHPRGAGGSGAGSSATAAHPKASARLALGAERWGWKSLP